jgi:hypothetical protein
MRSLRPWVAAVLVGLFIGAPTIAGTFVTSTSTPSLFTDKVTAPNARLPSGWTTENVTQAADLNTIKNALLDLRTDVREREFYVKHYGAACDGSTNDTSAFQSAYTAAAVAGGVVTFPHNATCIIDGSSPIVVGSNTHTVGNGATLKLRVATYTTDSAFFTNESSSLSQTYNAGIAVEENISFQGFTLDGNMSNVTMGAAGTMEGIHLYQVRNALVRNVRIKDLPGTISAAALGKGFGIGVFYSTSVRIDSVHIDRTDRANVAIWETTDATISNSTLKNSYGRENVLVSTNPTSIHQPSRAVIRDSTLENTLTTAYHSVRFSGKGSGVVSGNKITAFKTPAWAISTAYVVGQKVTNDSGKTYICDTAGTSAGAGGPTGTSTDITDGTARWDYVESNAGQAVFITDIQAKDVKVTDNVLSDSQYGVYIASDSDDGRRVTVDNNTITSCAYGIYGSAAGGSAFIRGNEVLGTTNNPLTLGFVSNKVVVGNRFRGGTQVFLRADPPMSADVETEFDTEAETSSGGLFANNVIQEMTNGSAALSIGGTATEEMDVIGNVLDNNTVNIISHLALGLIAGNRGVSSVSSTTAEIVQGGFRGSATWDPASLADGAGETSSAITVTGAAFGDQVQVGVPVDLQGMLVSAYVSASNTVRIRIQNETGGVLDLASGTWRVFVHKRQN